MKKVISIVMIVAVIFTLTLSSFAESRVKNEAELVSADNNVNLNIDAEGAYLMEAVTGHVLYAHGEFDAASPASVTKIMTLLLVCEALDNASISLTDMVSISAYAASMGGSQVFLEEGERMSVEDLIKCTVIASANDAAVALAEHVAGSESTFVARMNERAAELGLRNTSFENTTGLDDTTVNHYSCAADIGRMSRELIKHDVILKYSSMWQDTIRDGEFTLTNTNRLVRYYEGCNGLKTGSTDKAGYCVSTTAKRGNMQLIAVIMGAPSRDARNNAARALLDYGFSSFALYERGEEYLQDASVTRGRVDNVKLYSAPFSCVVPKAGLKSIEMKYDIPESLAAPVKKGDVVGEIKYFLGDEQLGSSDIFTDRDVEKINFWQIFVRILSRITAG